MLTPLSKAVFAYAAVIAALLSLWGCAPAAPGAQAGPLSMGEIDIAADAFGVGDVVRPGDWAGIRLVLTDSSQRQREVLVRIALEDADGDRPWYETVVTTNPGVRQPVWLYLRLPYGTAQANPLLVSVFEAEESEDGEDLGFAAGRLLGSAPVSPRRVVSSSEGMIGIVGSRLLGLGRYGMFSDQNPWLPTGHERSELVRGLTAGALPDRWLGLAQFDVLVWGEGSPNALAAEQAQALREWVMRGGHLVVALPPVGQTWTDELNNPLFDIVPRVRIQTREGVDLAPYRGLFSDQRSVALPTRANVQEMSPLPDASPGEAVRIIDAAAPADGSPAPALVARRIVGTGAVTLVGFDLGASQLASRGLPDAHSFWHRVLGRRGKLQSAEEFAQEATSQARSAAMLYGREAVTFDRDIPEQIAKSRLAGAGVLLGFVVFIAYWAVAGPGGFALLKMKGWTRHAWVAFMAAAGIFTAVAWGGATLIRPHRVDGTHLTLLDHVYGQNVQRARAWMSLLIPRYGEAGVSVEDPGTLGRPGARPEWYNAVAPWEAPGQAGGGGGFPDARGYRISARAPDTMFVPVRATVKQVQLDWAGGPRWQMPRPVAGGGEGPGEIRLREGPAGAGPQQPALLTGSLVHDLPGPLTDVVIIVNRGQRILRPINSTTQMLSDSFAFKLTAPWEPRQVLDLSTVTRVAGDRTSALTYFSDLLRAGVPDNTAGGIVADPANAGTRLTALAFFSQLAPPDYTIADNRQRRLAARRAAHGYDLGLWFTQPSVIIVGQLGAGGEDEHPSPVPVSVNTDGEWRQVRTGGRTVVRWVYPLGERPPEHPAWTEEPPPEEPAAPEPPPGPGDGPDGEGPG